MSFESVYEFEAPINFYRLLKKPTEKEIISISDLNKNDKRKYYFYIDFKCDNKEISVGFNVKYNSDTNKISIGENTKLYPLISYFSGLNSNTIECEFVDILEVLENKKFTAIAVKEKIGNTVYYVLKPVKKE